jgi:cellulose biosynthesis protein BcsQ
VVGGVIMENIKVSKVICFASAKGGTGKTTISATLAKFLVGLDKKVLLVDMDAVTNGLTLLYVEEMLKAKIHLTKEEASANVKNTITSCLIYRRGLISMLE